VYRPAAGWGAFGVKVMLGCIALGAVLAWAAQGIDWIGLQSAPWQRAGLLAAVLAGVAVLYFGVLAACGVRLREFMRRA
jgi:putative peptidoglycan lipid II flippase